MGTSTRDADAADGKENEKLLCLQISEINKFCKFSRTLHIDLALLDANGKDEFENIDFNIKTSKALVRLMVCVCIE